MCIYHNQMNVKVRKKIAANSTVTTLILIPYENWRGLYSLHHSRTECPFQLTLCPLQALGLTARLYFWRLAPATSWKVGLPLPSQLGHTFSCVAPSVADPQREVSGQLGVLP